MGERKINWFALSGVSLNFALMEVYNFRSKNRNLTGGGILNYTNGWTYNVFNMTLFVIALLARRYVIAVLIFGIQVFFLRFQPTRVSYLFLLLF